MKQILSDAFEIAPTVETEEEIISMQFQLLPLIERIYNPSTNALSKTDLQHFKPYKTMDDVLSVLFGASFLDNGIMTFDARVERQKEEPFEALFFVKWSILSAKKGE